MSDRIRNRATTDREIIAHAKSCLADLDHAIGRIDSGEDGARRQVAGALRALILGGEGNEVLQRIVRRTGAVPPLFGPLDAPNTPVDPDAISVVSLAALPFPSDGQEVPLDEALELQCLFIREAGEDWSYSWRKLLSLAADKLGVHFDEKVPLAVDAMFRKNISSIDSMTFLLRQFGVATSRYGHRLLGVVDAEYRVPDIAHHDDTSPRTYGVTTLYSRIEHFE